MPFCEPIVLFCGTRDARSRHGHHIKFVEGRLRELKPTALVTNYDALDRRVVDERVRLLVLNGASSMRPVFCEKRGRVCSYDGIQIAKYIRQRFPERHIPIMMLDLDPTICPPGTNMSRRGIADSEGIDVVLRRSVDQHRLMRVVAELLERSC